MTLDPLAVVPAIAAAAVIYTDSAEAALYNVYLPVLLLLPDSYYFGWPPLNFHQFAIVPIGLTMLWWVMSGRWRVSWIDLAVFSFIGWGIAADLHAIGTENISDHLAVPLTLAVFPYMAGKLLIEQAGMRLAIARRFAFFLFIDAMLAVYEFRFAVNPYRMIFGRFFSTPDPWFVQVRYGVGRIAGPFGHAIFMGAMVAVAILLYRYTRHLGLWEKRFSWFPNLKLNKQTVILWVLIAGSIMTVSRGPWIAMAVGLMVASIGTAQDRWRALRRAVLILGVGGGLIYFGGKAYVSGANVAGAKSHADQEELASAEYRAQLLDKYGDIAKQQQVWGWGSEYYPRVHGMISVDNWYLLLTLMYGVTGLVLFLAMLAVALLSLLKAGFFASDLMPDHRAMLFTLSGILIVISVAVATVFLGGQLYPILFFFLGWSDACVDYRPGRSWSDARAFAFRRVIA